MYLRNKTTAMTMTAKTIPAAAAPPTMSGKLSPVSNNKRFIGHIAHLDNSSSVSFRTTSNVVFKIYSKGLEIVHGLNNLNKQ